VRGSADGVLEDYAAFAQACMTLLGATGEVEWFETAESLLDRVLEQFVAGGSYFDTAEDAEELVWLNCYHAHVLARIGPTLDGADLEWLRRACAPIEV